MTFWFADSVSRINFLKNGRFLKIFQLLFFCNFPTSRLKSPIKSSINVTWAQKLFSNSDATVGELKMAALLRCLKNNILKIRKPKSNGLMLQGLEILYHKTSNECIALEKLLKCFFCEDKLCKTGLKLNENKDNFLKCRNHTLRLC